MKKIKNTPPHGVNQHIKKSVNFVLKVLTAASIISCLTLTEFSANAEDTDIYLKKSEYGTGKNTAYFKWEKNDNGDYELNKTSEKNEAQITVHYDESTNQRKEINSKTELINQEFVNLAHDEDATNVQGGAIYNNSTIVNIEGDFISNDAKASTNGRGGAIFNVLHSQIDSITGDFIGNFASGGTEGCGGAVYNSGTMTSIKSDFIGNYATGGHLGHGGAVYNIFSINTINGDFIGNYAKGGTEGFGGAVFNTGTIGTLDGDFKSNYIEGNETKGGGIFNDFGETIDNIKGDFISNHAQGTKLAYGGAVYNEGTINTINGDFTNNSVKGQIGYGGAIYNDSETYSNTEIKSIIGNFSGNKALGDDQGYGGAIYNDKGTIVDIKGNFYNNTASNSGGAIYNTGTIGTLTNSSFIGNTAGTHGGAIYTTKDITIEADNDEVVFSGNTAGGNSEAIYVADATANVTMSAKGSGSYRIDDQIDGMEGYGLNFDGAGSSKLVLNNKIKNADIDFDGFTAKIGTTDYLNGNNSLTMKSGEINFGELSSDGLHFRKFDFQKGNINIDNVNVDLENQVMGRITADEYGEAGSGLLTLKGLTVIKDKEADQIPVLFADSSFADGVNINVKETQGPIFKYAVSYSKDGTFDALMKSGRASGDGNNGYVVFTKINYNPAVQATSIAQLAGVYSAVMQSFEYSFEHADTFSALPASVRKAKLNDNKYAINEAASLPSYYNELTKKSMWFRPYTTFENVPLKNGPKVSNVVYGSYAGGDSEIIPLKNGWSTVYTGYVGYNGSHQSFDGNSTYQNGVILGVTDTFYKDKFYTAITMSVGTSFGETSTSFGNEDFTTLYGGVATKTGYNFEFNDGRYIIQPNLLFAYTFINTFDYTNAAGVRLDSDPLHSLQVNPHVKFILNTQSGWQPYLTGGFVYNVMGQSQVKAIEGDAVYSLPALSIKPYAEYGVGIQKLWNDKYTGFLQATIRSGGRNGVGFVTGFRWALGDDSRVEEVQKPDKNIKTVSNVIKTEKSAASDKTQQIGDEEHHSFIYNRMLKFSNFFCKPSNPKFK